MLSRAILLSYTFHQIVLPAFGQLSELSPIPNRCSAGRSLSIKAANYPLLTKGKELKKKPDSACLYEYDHTPLGDRLPFLLVHGLRGEYYQGFRWGLVTRRFLADEVFSKKFKLYFARYDSLAPVNTIVPYMKNAIAGLYETAQRRPISIMALSIGGNLVFDSMLDATTNSQVRMLMTLGTPFHGSPLFSSNWLNYGIYKSWSLPWTRIDRAIAYRLYFARNPNLLVDYAWDNSDSAIPDKGHFASLLPFGPHGDLRPISSANTPLAKLADSNFDRKKLIAYSGYLVTPYLLPQPARFIAGRLMSPLTLFNIEIPSHIGKEHPVLKMLNRQITMVESTSQASALAKTQFVYRLNDGIAPLSSALFLQPKYARKQLLSNESDIVKIKECLDLHGARVFRDIDHLTFIDGKRRLFGAANGTMSDELDKAAGRHDIFDWMLLDITEFQDDDSRIAKEAASSTATQRD